MWRKAAFAHPRDPMVPTWAYWPVTPNLCAAGIGWPGGCLSAWGQAACTPHQAGRQAGPSSSRPRLSGEPGNLRASLPSPDRRGWLKEVFTVLHRGRQPPVCSLCLSSGAGGPRARAQGRSAEEPCARTVEGDTGRRPHGESGRGSKGRRAISPVCAAKACGGKAGCL